MQCDFHHGVLKYHAIYEWPTKKVIRVGDMEVIQQLDFNKQSGSQS